MMKIAAFAASMATLALFQGCKSDEDKLAAFTADEKKLEPYQAKFTAELAKPVPEAGVDPTDANITPESVKKIWDALVKDCKDLKTHGDAAEKTWKQLVTDAKGDPKKNLSEDKQKELTKTSDAFTKYKTTKDAVVAKFNECQAAVAAAATADANKVSPEDILKVLPEYETPTAPANGN